MLNKKHFRLFASILILVGILLFATAPVLSASAALPALQDDPPQDPPEQPEPPVDDDPDIIIPETGEQQQTVDASWIIWLVIGIVIIILLVALLARGRGPRV
jgi:hypothetical protein